MRLSRFRRLRPAERTLLCRAAAWVVWVRLSLWLFPFQSVWRRTLLWSRAREYRGDFAPGEVVETVARISRYVPWASCLTQALASFVLLRRFGHPCRLRIGVSRTGQGLLAHAWVESNGEVLNHGNDVSDYTLLPDLGGEGG
jgi:hypothetical protein